MKKHIFGILGAATLSCILLSCAMPAEPSAEAGFGKVSISFASGAERTVLPERVFHHYTYTFIPAGANSGTEEQPNDNIFELKTGTYTVNVKAYIGEKIPANLAAEGTSSSFQVESGTVKTVTVNLTGKTSGTGIFTYKISYSNEAYKRRTFTVTKLTAGTNGTQEASTPLVTKQTNSTDPDNNDEEWRPTELTDTISDADAGFYMVTILLERTSDEKTAGKSEVVHIYDNMTTVFETRFDTQDFVGTPLGGSVDIKLRPVAYAGSNPPAGTSDEDLPSDLVVGDLLVAVPSVTSKGQPVSDGLSYQWYRHGAATGAGQPIEGAFGSIYMLTPDDVGMYISVQVTRPAKNIGMVSSIADNDGNAVGAVRKSFTSVADLETWLSNQTSTPDNPLLVTLKDIDISTITSALNLNGQYVSIDLSRLTATAIPAGLFNGCTTLTDVTLPDTLETIENNAFNGCTALTEITLPNSIASIQNSAFSGCTSLTTVTLSSSLASIETNGFSGCSALTTVICLAEIPPTLASGVFTGAPAAMEIKVPVSNDDDGDGTNDVLAAYQAAWTAYANQISESE